MVKIKILTAIVLFTSIEILNAQNWSPFDNGVNGFVQKTYFDSLSNKLYAVGNFTDASGANANRIATWDGTLWNNVPNNISLLSAPTAPSNGLSAVTFYNGSLIVTGYDYYNTSTLIGSNVILQNDGVNWSPLGSGISGGSGIAMIVHNNELYVGGRFTDAGGISVNNIAKWDGTNWSSVGDSIPGIDAVTALAFYNNELYAGTKLTNIATSNNKALFKLNGTHWELVSFDTAPYIFCMEVYNNELYVGGTNVGSTGTTLIRYDGSVSNTLGTNISQNIQSMHNYNGNLYIGGAFTTINGYSASNVVKWNGTSFSPLGSGTNGRVNSITHNSQGLIVGGQFVNAGGTTVNNIALWGSSTGFGKDLTINNQANISPNPSSGEFIITTNNSVAATISITNILGEIIHSNKSANTTNEIDLSNQSKGIYFVTVNGEGINETKKVIIE